MSGYLGELLIITRLERAVIAHFKLWQDTYLAEIERLTDREPRTIPGMRSYSVKSELDKFPEEQLPAMVVVSPGVVADTIVKEGDGSYSAQWDLGIAVVSSARDEHATDDLRAYYGAAIRAVFLQHPAVGEVGVIAEWVDESYNDLPVDADRTVSVVQVLFRVQAEMIVEAAGGTREPLEDPYEEYQHPEVTGTEIDISKIGD